MSRGLRRDQIGVTEALIGTYGDTVFELSHNYQIRRGDPVRELDWEEIERQRENTGLSDPEIARKLGLTREQVTYIRVMTEHRRFNRRQYPRLYDLGGGRRFRAERFTPHEDRFAFSAGALALRDALAFDSARAARFLREGHWNADTVSSWLAARAEAAPDSRAARQGNAGMSYGEIFEASLCTANGLLELGLAKGDVVAVQLPNTLDFMVFYFAATMIGAVVSPMHMPYRGGEIEPLLRHGSARAMLCGAATESHDAPATMLALRDAVPALDHVIVAGDEAPPGAIALAELRGAGSTAGIASPPVAADPAILCFTSGTAAAPKAVVHNYHTMLSNNRNAAALYALAPDDVVLGLPPFTHAFGICVMNLTLMAGATALLMPAFSPAGLMELIETGRPSVLFAAPAHIAASMAAGLLDTRDLSSLRIATISGSTCPPEVAHALEDAMPNGSVGQMWGMSECFMGLHTPFDGPAARRCESLGGPTPTFEVRIAGPDDSVVEDSAEGELQIRGSSVIAGYFDNAQANRDAFAADGWFRTGDLAVRDGNGDIRITGRVKDVINRGGIKINPTDVEAVIDRHPAVVASAIVPFPDDVLGEKAAVHVELLGGTTLDLDDIRRWLEEHGVAKIKWPEALEFVDRMPMTPTRKIIKSALGASQRDA